MSSQPDDQQSEPARDVVSTAPQREVVVERQVAVPSPERSSRIGPFVAGFVTAIVLGAIGALAFLAISDEDDDGELEIEVPAVDVDVDG